MCQTVGTVELAEAKTGGPDIRYHHTFKLKGRCY